MFNRIIKYLEKHSWKYIIPEDGTETVIFGINTSNGKFQIIIGVEEDNKRLVCFSIFPINTPSELRQKVAELLIRINHTLFFGAFEMDFEDGEIRFKTTLAFDNLNISDDILDVTIQGNISTIDNNIKLINSFISDSIDFDRAIDIIKSNAQHQA